MWKVGILLQRHNIHKNLFDLNKTIIYLSFFHGVINSHSAVLALNLMSAH